VIHNFALKHVARELAKAAGVPVLEGSGLVTSTEAAVEAAEHIGYPVLLKATGGGGGRGIYICNNADEVVGQFGTSQKQARGQQARRRLSPRALPLLAQRWERGCAGWSLPASCRRAEAQRLAPARRVRRSLATAACLWRSTSRRRTTWRCRSLATARAAAGAWASASAPSSAGAASGWLLALLLALPRLSLAAWLLQLLLHFQALLCCAFALGPVLVPAAVPNAAHPTSHSTSRPGHLQAPEGARGDALAAGDA
jgi:hypothetical protein